MLPPGQRRSVVHFVEPASQDVTHVNLGVSRLDTGRPGRRAGVTQTARNRLLKGNS